MSQNLTQPEEVDHVLMEMARHDVTEGRPVSGEAKSVLHGFECDWSIGATDSSCGALHHKPMHGLRNP